MLSDHTQKNTYLHSLLLHRNYYLALKIDHASVCLGATKDKMDTLNFWKKNVLENAPQQSIFLSRDRYGFPSRAIATDKRFQFRILFKVALEQKGILVA